MNFTERFKGKTSTITKEGLTALIQSSQIPIAKRSDSPELSTFEDSRARKTPPPFIPSAYSTQNNSNHPLSHQKQSPVKYPATWSAAESLQSPGFVLANIKPIRPIMTHNNTPLTFKDDTQAYWNNGIPNNDNESGVPSSIVLGGLVRNSKSQFNDYLPSITGLDEKSQYRSKSNIRERVGGPDDYFNGRIRPSYNDIDIKDGYRPLVQKGSLGRISPVKSGALRSQDALNTENNDIHLQNQMETSGSGMRRAITYRELRSNEGYNNGMKDRRPMYQDQAQRKGEGMIAQLVEANVVKYLDSIYGMTEQNKEFMNKFASYQNLESDTEQRSSLNVKNKRMDLRSGPVQEINSARNLSQAKQKKDKEGKQEVRVKFKNVGDILDQVKSHPEYKPHRSNSNQSNMKDYVDEMSREGNMSPFRRLTKNILNKNIES